MVLTFSYPQSQTSIPIFLTALALVTTFNIASLIAYWIMVLNEENQYFFRPFVQFCSVYFMLLHDLIS